MGGGSDIGGEERFSYDIALPLELTHAMYF